MAALIVSRASHPVTTWRKSTRRKCTCNWLQRAAEDSKVPIVFDTEMNEFHLQHENGEMVLYYCPFCGWAAPDSLRATLFARLSLEEHHRLDLLTQRYKTLDEILAAFGPPDRDWPVGLRTSDPQKGDEPPTHRSYRVIEYEKLSEVADVAVTIGLNDRVRISYRSKYVGPKCHDQSA